MLIIALGYISKRFRILSEIEGKALSKIVLNLTLPALIIDTFSNLHLEFSLAVLPLISLSFGVLISLAAIFFFRKQSPTIKGMLIMLVPGFNIGLFAYPFVEILWGTKGLKYLAMFDMGNAFIVFALCYFLGSLFSKNKAAYDLVSSMRESVKSIPLIAYFLTLVLNMLGLHFPSFILEISKILSKANTPLSLLTLGLFFSFSFEKGYMKNIIKVFSMRYIAGAAVGLSLYFILPFDPLVRAIVLICLLLPPALSEIPYSIIFNYDVKFVGTYLNISNVISFLLLWLISGITMSL